MHSGPASRSGSPSAAFRVAGMACLVPDYRKSQAILEPRMPRRAFTGISGTGKAGERHAASAARSASRSAAGRRTARRGQRHWRPGRPHRQAPRRRAPAHARAARPTRPHPGPQPPALPRAGPAPAAVTRLRPGPCRPPLGRSLPGRLHPRDRSESRDDRRATLTNSASRSDCPALSARAVPTLATSAAAELPGTCQPLGPHSPHHLRSPLRTAAAGLWFSGCVLRQCPK
jgi:hypothetical protein